MEDADDINGYIVYREESEEDASIEEESSYPHRFGGLGTGALDGAPPTAD